MFYTPNDLRLKFAARKKSASESEIYASEPKPLFDESGIFNPNNWASDQDVIRSGFHENDLLHNGNSFRAVRVDGHANTTLLTADIFHIGEQWFVTIDGMSSDKGLYFSYIITWYKDRGCTEMILKNGKPATIYEYTDLLNNLEYCNFYDKNNWHINDHMNFID